MAWVEERAIPNWADERFDEKDGTSEFPLEIHFDYVLIYNFSSGWDEEEDPSEG
jgi:hypothetical protein